MHINVSHDGGGHKYSLGTRTPQHHPFTHHFTAPDQITWACWQSNKRVQVTFTKTCPFVNADGTPWPNKTATFPGHAAKLDPNLPRDQYYTPHKYTITLPDSPGAPADDPEVIIVDA
jgi:hypothetical protein